MYAGRRPIRLPKVVLFINCSALGHCVNESMSLQKTIWNVGEEHRANPLEVLYPPNYSVIERLRISSGLLLPLRVSRTRSRFRNPWRRKVQVAPDPREPSCNDATRSHWCGKCTGHFEHQTTLFYVFGTSARCNIADFLVLHECSFSMIT
jgi:hypothetical protein